MDLFSFIVSLYDSVIIVNHKFVFGYEFEKQQSWFDLKFRKLPKNSTQRLKL